MTSTNMGITIASTRNTTSSDRPTLSHTSVGDSVRMEKAPNSVEQTSPDRLPDVGKIFISK